jgi:small subunit ribosomal protein S13
MPKEFRHITRIAETDLDGSLKVSYAISEIKGIGANMANAIAKMGGIDPDIRLGFLSDQDLEKLEDIIKNPFKYNIPEWLFNRQKDFETGKNLHLIGSDLVLQTKSDIDSLKASKSWRGYRHSYGLKVRGQRTKTTGRKGKAIGVRKKRRPGSKE